MPAAQPGRVLGVGTVGPEPAHLDYARVRKRTVSSVASGQREGDDRVARRGLEELVAAGGDDDELAIRRTQAIGHGRRLPPRGQATLPELITRLAVEGAQVVVGSASIQWPFNGLANKSRSTSSASFKFWAHRCWYSSYVTISPVERQTVLPGFTMVMLLDTASMYLNIIRCSSSVILAPCLSLSIRC